MALYTEKDPKFTGEVDDVGLQPVSYCEVVEGVT